MKPLVTIYGLCSPVTRVVYYVGQSINPYVRLNLHISAAHQKRNGSASRKDDWINYLLSVGTRPLMEVLAMVPEDIADEVECLIIGMFDRQGDLLNSNKSGGLQIQKAEPQPSLKHREPYPKHAARVYEAVRASGLTIVSIASAIGKPGNSGRSYVSQVLHGH